MPDDGTIISCMTIRAVCAIAAVAIAVAAQVTTIAANFVAPSLSSPSARRLRSVAVGPLTRQNIQVFVLALSLANSA
jgi:hypothetical protein